MALRLLGFILEEFGAEGDSLDATGSLYILEFVFVLIPIHRLLHRIHSILPTTASLALTTAAVLVIFLIATVFLLLGRGLEFFRAFLELVLIDRLEDCLALLLVELVGDVADVGGERLLLLHEILINLLWLDELVDEFDCLQFHVNGPTQVVEAILK